MAKEESKLSLSAKAKKFGVSLKTLRKVYNRGMAAWNSGHRPGTTPQQWGHARVNSYLRKGKTYHTADKDLHEEALVRGTNCKNCIWWKEDTEQKVDKSELNENGGLKAPNEQYIKMSKHVDMVSLPGKATVSMKAFCDHDDVKNFVTERMCCAYWNGEGTKREFKGEADVLSEDIDTLFERMLFLDADPDQALAAAELEKAGESEEQIWKKKGAFKDPYTGKWTKEISDKEMDIPGFKSQMGIQSKKVPYAPAQTAIKHDKLFKNVPGVKSTQVSTQSITPVEKVFGNIPYSGIFRSGSSPSLRTLSVTKKGALDTTAHELQHNVDALQGNLKTPGYNAASFSQSKASNLMRHSVDPNEIRANATMSRRELDDKQRRERFPLKDYKLGGSIFGGKLGVPVSMVPKSLREMQLVGTDEYRQHAIAMTPGQDQEIKNAFPFDEYGNETVSDENTENDINESDGSFEFRNSESTGISFREIRRKIQEQQSEEEQAQELLAQLAAQEGEQEGEIEGEEQQGEDDGAEDGVDFTPNLKTKKVRNFGPNNYAASDMSGMPVLTTNVGMNEAIEYHMNNNISLVENIYRPGSEMFFAMILEAKRLYVEGNYTPKNEDEKDLLESDIGEVAEYEGQPVVLDFPVDDSLEECWKGYAQQGMKKKGNKMVPNCVPMNEEGDPTHGKGIGKPFRSRGGGAVYVRNGKGNIIKVNFSQSGMRKRFNEPGRVKSFIARHHCYSNKDRTSASYWACRWPRYFSDSGQQWW